MFIWILALMAAIGVLAVAVICIMGFILIGKALNDNALGNEWDEMEDDE